MTTWAVFSGTRGQEKDEWSRSEHSRRLWKWRFVVYIVAICGSGVLQCTESVVARLVSSPDKQAEVKFRAR